MDIIYTECGKATAAEVEDFSEFRRIAYEILGM